ncbi:MAG: hypothetical protein ABR569_09625 [Gaiellaceae bacterium]
MRRRLLLSAAVVALAGAGALAWAVVRPDPHTEALADGCARSRQAQFAREAPGWAYVDDRDYRASGPAPPPQWLLGTVNANGNSAEAAHPSGGDDPTTHHSFDVNVNVLPGPAYSGLLGGDPASKSGNFEGVGQETNRVHIERETESLPVFAWGQPGDRIKVLGSWVWDCGHWDPGGERTELHPYRAIWLARTDSSVSPWGESEGDLYISTDATPAGVLAECGHLTKGDRVAFKACLTTEPPRWLDVSGDYDLILPAPPRPAGAKRLVARVVNRGSTIAVEQPTLEPGHARLRFHLVARAGRRLVLAEQIFLGWSPVRPEALPVHLRVRFDRLVVQRAMDPSGGAESTLAGQIAKSPGEWRIYADVAERWSLWPELFRARDASSFALRREENLYVRAGVVWRLLIWPHECDFGLVTFDDPRVPMAPCPASGEFGNVSGDDMPGLIVVRNPAPGFHRSEGGLDPPSTCPRSNQGGCYRLEYTVVIVRDARQRARP